MIISRVQGVEDLGHAVIQISQYKIVRHVHSVFPDADLMGEGDCCFSHEGVHILVGAQADLCLEMPGTGLRDIAGGVVVQEIDESFQ